MSNSKKFLEYQYVARDDYDKTVKINGDEIDVYSPARMEAMYPAGANVVGETYENKKRDKSVDVGKIDLAEKYLYLSPAGTHSRLFRKPSGYVEVNGNRFVTLLKLRLLPILLAIVIALGAVAGGIVAIVLPDNPPGGEIDPNIKPIENEKNTVSGDVKRGTVPKAGATLTLQSGNVTVATATTDASGKYLIPNVPNGIYNLVCEEGDSTLTLPVTVESRAATASFVFPTDVNSAVRAIVKINDAKTPAVAVGGLSEEVTSMAISGKKVDLTLTATKLDTADVPPDDVTKITAISGELTLTYFDFSVLKEIFSGGVSEGQTKLTTTENVLEIAIPYDSRMDVDTLVFRCHGGTASKLTKLNEKPASDYQNGTFFVTADTVYIYTNEFSTYTIGSAKSNNTVKGADVISYSPKATLNLGTGKITMLYEHGSESTNDSYVQIYLVGTPSNVLISESGLIPPGNKLAVMTVKDGVTLPSVGTYQGLMKILYVSGTKNQVTTNVDIPITVTVTQ